MICDDSDKAWRTDVVSLPAPSSAGQVITVARAFDAPSGVHIEGSGITIEPGQSETFTAEELARFKKTDPPRYMWIVRIGESDE